MDSWIIFGLIVLGGFAIAASAKHNSVDGMEDTPVSIDNIRKGVARGWYSATLCRVDGIPAVRLTGEVGGKPYSDVFQIAETDWQTLKNEGYSVAEQ